jgi:hypothetical protein
MLRINLNPFVLVSNHLLVEFEKIPATRPEAGGRVFN